MAILFFSEGIDFHLAKPRITTSWIKDVIKKEKRKLHSLNYIFCSDKYLARLNSQYLSHEALTDILTFDYSKDPKSIHGEIYISIERIKENASRFKETFDRELHRVIIHGVLHLAGYSDKRAAKKALMREKEEAYLSLR
jgi:probable rRNA maturation factor